MRCFEVFTAMVLGTAVSGCAAIAPAAPATPGDGYLQRVERVAEGVHVMRQALPNFAGVVGNVTIIEQSDGLVLVDSGSSYGDGARVARAVRALSSKPVTAVIVTHWHNDHPLGLAAIVAAWPDADIIATEATREALGRTGAPSAPDPAWEARRRETLQGYIPDVARRTEDQSLSPEERAGWARALSALAIRLEDVAGTHLVAPTRTFRDGLTLDDPLRPVEVRFEGRANTDGDAHVWLPRQRILIGGDVVVWPIPYHFNVFPSDNIATLQRLRAYDFDVLIPGHGEPLRDKSYLDLLIAFMSEVQAQTAPLARSGRSVEDITVQLSMDAYAQRFAGEDPWLRYWFREYALVPLIESVYAETRGGSE